MILHAALACALVPTALAQDRFPSRPVTILVPSAAGGGQDVIMRIVAPALGQSLGQAVIVENRPGASGVIASTAVVKSRPDGYLMMVTSAIQGALNRHFQRGLPYDPNTDLIAVAGIAAGPNVLVVSPALPVRSIPELISFARSNPDKLTFASNGLGSGQHMVGELFNMLAGVSVLHVPFKGSGEYLAQIMGNNVSMGYASTLATMPLIAAGKLRALGVTSQSRVKSLPDVPAIAEFTPMEKFAYLNWVGLYTPSGTPGEVISVINRAVGESLRNPAVTDALRKLGNDPVIMTPAEVQAYVRQQADQITRLVIERNIQVSQ